MARTLVLGANGFIGSHLVDSLASRGHDVRAFDRFGSRGPIFNEKDTIEIFRGDFLNRGDLAEALKDIEYVFHFISTTTPATAENDPTIDIETNIRMSVELFELCKERSIKRLFFASTGGAIYGDTQGEEPHKETDRIEPVSPYAIGKSAIENYLRYYRSKYGLASTSLRISNPYGERQPSDRRQGVIPIFLDRLRVGRPVMVYGDGEMVRDYIYVKDVADIVVDMLEHEHLQDLYNIGSGNGTTVNEILEIAMRVSGKQAKIETRPTPSTFVKEVVLDTSRLTKQFGSRILTDLETGMQATYEYIQH